MPYSIVLELYRADKSGNSVAPITGEHLQAAFLNLLSQADPTLAADFHSGDRLRGYSLGILSPTIFKEASRTTNNHYQMKASRLLLRLACLDDRVYPALVHLMLDIGATNASAAHAATDEANAYVQSVPRLEVSLGSGQFFISRLLATPESGSHWSGYCEVNDLMKRASREERFLRIRFASPTTFGQGSRDESLPTPEIVFPGLARRWNAVYGEKLPIPEEEFSANVNKCVAVSDYRIESARMPVGHDPCGRTLWQTGCLGTVLYRIVGEPEAPFIYLINLLADVAIFSGLGKKTSRGCGMVRRIT